MLKTVICSLAVLVLLAGPSTAADKPAFDTLPNIIFIITDDQGYGDVGCHGNPMLKTPNLDRLHRESVRFTRFQVSPTCAPTRSALMSGRHEFYVGVTHTIHERERMALGVPTLPEMLRRAGYTTGIFGKWHLGDQDPHRPDRRGFDEVYIHGAGGIGQSYSGTCGDAPGNKYFDPWVLHNNKFVKTDGFCTDVFFAQALAWIESQKGNKRFFAYITTNAPHGPLIAPEEYKKAFIAQGLSDGQAAYYGMIKNIDDNVGRLLAKLAQWKIDRDTLLVFITDNGSAAGWSFNAGMKGKKGSVDEGGTRVPCFFRWPGVLEPGTDVDRIAAHLDMLPTFAEIVGGEPEEKEKLHGRSLVPLLRDPDAEWQDRHLFSHRGRWGKGQAAGAKYGPFAVRSQQWRMVGREQLYDMENDPGQKTNVIGKNADVAAAMLAAYDRWWEGALPLMVNEDAPEEGPNTFHVMFYKQFGKTPPPPKKKRAKKPK
ncbi:MAG: arylsulfatase [Candidatus Nealsonbacteria bacterium]|nr:arylsulfatase [Candidatus Nealsonbacteria bacterium]